MYMTIYGHSGRICCSGQLGLHIWPYLQSDWCVDNSDIRQVTTSPPYLTADTVCPNMETQLSRATDPATMSIYGHVHLL